MARSAETQRHGRSGHFFRQTARLCSRHTGRAALLSVAAWFHQGTPKRLLWALHGAFRCGVQKRSATVEVVTSFAKRRDYAVGTQAARRCCQWPRGLLWGLRKGSCGRCMEHSAAACRCVSALRGTLQRNAPCSAHRSLFRVPIANHADIDSSDARPVCRLHSLAVWRKK